MRGQRISAANGAPPLLTGVTADITAQKRSEDRLERLQSELTHSGRVAEYNRDLTCLLGNGQAAREIAETQPQNMQPSKETKLVVGIA